VSKPTTKLLEEMLRGIDEQEQQDQTSAPAAKYPPPASPTTPLAEPRFTLEIPVVRMRRLAPIERLTTPLTEGDE
jgi:hypothetical protein